MKNHKIHRFIGSIIIGLIAITLSACGSGSSSSSGSSGPTMQSVAAFYPESSVSNSTLWINNNPPSGAWSSYMSGTTQSIIAMAANASEILGFTGSDFIMSSPVGGQFNVIPFTGSPITAATIVAGTSGFVLYSTVNNAMLFVSNAGQITTVSNFPEPIANITNVSYFGGIFYAYTTSSLVYQSTDGVSWTQITGGENIRPYTEVVQLSDGLFAAMVAPVGSNPNLWLGTSPSNFSSVNLNNFFNSPAQVNFIASGGGYLYINETVYATNRTIRIYKIFNASQVNTGALIGSFEIPGTSDYVKPTNIFITPATVYVPTATTTESSGNVIDPNGPTTLTAAPNVQAPSITTQLVGSQSQTKGSLYAVSGTDLLVAPGSESSNNGDLTLIKDATVPYSPYYQVLPSGLSATYAALIGSNSSFLVLLNNGGVLQSSGGTFVPATAIANRSSTDGSVAISKVLSSGYVNNSYLVQATRFESGDVGDLFFSNDNGKSWTTISESALVSANLGSLTESAVSINHISGLFNITTQKSESSGTQIITYQTATPTNLVSWVKTVTPTPLLLVNGVQYTFYPNSNDAGRVVNGAYVVMPDTLPQNYVSTGNIAVNNAGMIALAQPATIVEAVDKIAGSNYLWTSSTNTNAWLFADNWVLNVVNFSNPSGALPNENFNIMPILAWTGSTWVTYGNGNQLLQNTDPTSIYFSSDAINWSAAVQSGTLVTGVPVLF